MKIKLLDVNKMVWEHTIKVPMIIRCYMTLKGYRGLTTFWGKVYYLRISDMMDTRLYRHEEEHIRQYRRDGIWKYLIMYNYYWLRYGYHGNPYEIEAKKASYE